MLNFLHSYCHYIMDGGSIFEFSDHSNVTKCSLIGCRRPATKNDGAGIRTLEANVRETLHSDHSATGSSSENTVKGEEKSKISLI